MNAPDPIRAPQQKRSRETHERLLTATISVLNQFGLDGAVIPRIAETAKVSPASIYRRFANKDALLRAAILHALAQSNAANQRQLKTLLLRETLDATATRLMGMFFQQYRQHPQLMRAFARFLESDSDQAFVREALAIMAANLEVVAQVLLSHHEEIVHPDPKRALRIAMLTALTAIEAIAFKPTSLWQVLQPMSDDELGDELARGFVAYLKTSP
jgi:AcrR family transcriptional regulator